MTRRYDTWPGNPRGLVEIRTQCVVEVSTNWGLHRYQCARKRGHGPDGLFCKQHAKMVDDGKYVSVPEDKPRINPTAQEIA